MHISISHTEWLPLKWFIYTHTRCIHIAYGPFHTSILIGTKKEKKTKNIVKIAERVYVCVCVCPCQIVDSFHKFQQQNCTFYGKMPNKCHYFGLSTLIASASIRFQLFACALFLSPEQNALSTRQTSLHADNGIANGMVMRNSHSFDGWNEMDHIRVYMKLHIRRKAIIFINTLIYTVSN